MCFHLCRYMGQIDKILKDYVDIFNFSGENSICFSPENHDDNYKKGEEEEEEVQIEVEKQPLIPKENPLDDLGFELV